MGSVSNVQGLTLYAPRWFRLMSHSNSFELLSPIVTAGWAALGPNLRSLALGNIPLGHFHVAVTPTLLFPSLEELTISLTDTEVINGREPVCNILIPFINNHHSTLKSLQLSFVQYRNWNIDFSLLGICHLPHLQKLAYRYAFTSLTPTKPLGLWHILGLHADGLRELELGFMSTVTVTPGYFTYPLVHRAWCAQEFLRIALPHLETFALKAVTEQTLDHFLDVDLTASHLQQFATSLTTLKLQWCEFSYSSVEKIIDAFAGYGKLKTLHLGVNKLCPRLLDLFATKLPFLDRLHLIFTCITTARPHASSFKLIDDEISVSTC